jgi:hypothetical protein
VGVERERERERVKGKRSHVISFVKREDGTGRREISHARIIEGRRNGEERRWPGAGSGGAGRLPTVARDENERGRMKTFRAGKTGDFGVWVDPTRG